MYNIDVRDSFAITFGTAGTELEIKHNLGYIPLGFMVIEQSAAGSLYGNRAGTGVTMWTNKSLYLKCSANGVIATIILITGR